VSDSFRNGRLRRASVERRAEPFGSHEKVGRRSRRSGQLSAMFAYGGERCGRQRQPVSEDAMADFLAPPTLGLSPALPPGIVQAMDEAATEAAFSGAIYRDAADTSERYALALRQADDFVRILRRLEMPPPRCWYGHPQLVSLIVSLADQWSSSKASGVSFWNALFDLTRSSALWVRAGTHKLDQHPTDDATRTAPLLNFDEVVAAAERGETAMWVTGAGVSE
jgi:hypothetical protein